MKREIKKFLALSLIVLLVACKNSGNAQAQPVPSSADNGAIPVINYQVINMYPHDSTSFTEGLFLDNGKMYESTGDPDNANASKLLCYDYKTGKILKSVSVPHYFGEGISTVGNRLYQLTWKEHKVFVYDYPSLKKIGEMSWPHEGWGMTTDGKNLIISDGSSKLYYINPKDFSLIKTVNIMGEFGPQLDINELEYVDGFIYANLFQLDGIIKIDPQAGKVIGQLDLSNIRQSNGVSAFGNDVLNGIAYNDNTHTFLVTGKYWTKIFELRLN
ncbi:MAG: glutaminyl-peptide cyclotransferase [Desulfuromonadales bacterium]|nr:glutaminyl-peptide cyclotransferase [Desulfuromonadales bacterium]